MGIVTDALRPHWIAVIYSVDHRVSDGFRDWVASKNYQIYLLIRADQFILTIADIRPLCDAFAARGRHLYR